jgi:hypothetical protein
MLVVLVFVIGSAAFAHGDAEWIQRNPEYVDKLGHHCCGPQDCERIPADLMRQDGQDIHILPTRQKFRKGERGTYQSRDSSWWWCKSREFPEFIKPPPIKCIFFPFDES